MDTLSFTTKKELAMSYSPGCSYDTAQKRLSRWINGNPHLLKALKKENYKILQRTLTHKQLQVIFDHLGTP